jgi:hypothetical protein
MALFSSEFSLFLGICNSERTAEAIVQTSVNGSPVIALRFNSIRVDYTTIASSTTANRAVKLSPCAVRVDIYNGWLFKIKISFSYNFDSFLLDRTKKLQNRTFDSGVLAGDISKFVSSPEKDNADRIRILSNFDDRVNGRNYLSFSEFAKYYRKLKRKTKEIN